MKLKIHRGASQIGGNIVEIATDDEKTKIILDCGRNLPPLDDSDITDDIEINGLTNGTSAYDAVFVTHHHADHCGLIEQINKDIPIYMSKETEGVLNVVADFLDKPVVCVEDEKILMHEKPVRFGDISVLPLNVSHSARGALMFLVEADGKKLLYTGDFKSIDADTYDLIEKTGIDTLLCEGTNISAQKDMTECDIVAKAAQIMDETESHVFVLSSSTNIDRLQAIEKACKKSERALAIDPFMKAILDKLGYSLETDWIGFMPYYIDPKKWPRAHEYFMRNIRYFKSGDEIAEIAKKKRLTFMVRQSASMKWFLSNKLAPLTGSAMIYSIWKGYGKTAKTKDFIKHCVTLGMSELSEDSYLHTSGHAYRDALVDTISRLNPGTLIPIHTENADAFKKLFGNVVSLED